MGGQRGAAQLLNSPWDLAFDAQVGCPTRVQDPNHHLAIAEKQSAACIASSGRMPVFSVCSQTPYDDIRLPNGDLCRRTRCSWPLLGSTRSGATTWRQVSQRYSAAMATSATPMVTAPFMGTSPPDFMHEVALSGGLCMYGQIAP